MFPYYLYRENKWPSYLGWQLLYLTSIFIDFDMIWFRLNILNCSRFSVSLQSEPKQFPLGSIMFPDSISDGPNLGLIYSNKVNEE